MISIRVEEDTILNSLKSIVKHENKDAIIKLIHGLLIESPYGSEFFIKFLLNEQYPEVPKIADIGYINIGNHYIKNKEKLLNSGLVTNNFIECTVTSLFPVHNYSPIEVQFPFVDDNDQPTMGLIRIGLNDFYMSTDDL
jgi:hypothetical protein